MEQSKGEITAEQVERAIAKPRNIDYRELPPGWRELAPDYVIAAEAADDWDAEHAALTRWRDELAAAEPGRRVARWSEADGLYRLDPPHEYSMAGGESRAYLVARVQAIAWGYEIEGGPEPVRDWKSDRAIAAIWPTPKPAEDSPERLRERRERLGWTTAYAGHWVPWFDHTDVERAESGKGIPAFVARYAAALSAEEARRAAVGAWAAGGGVLHYSPPTEPERPAPRFKVVDLDPALHETALAATRMLHCGKWPLSLPRVGELPGFDAWNTGPLTTPDWIAQLEALLAEPASPPAPEVVDVPQPAPLPKTVAHFYTIRALPEPHRVSWNMPGDGPQWVRVNDSLWLHVDDLRAMLADIEPDGGIVVRNPKGKRLVVAPDRVRLLDPPQQTRAPLERPAVYDAPAGVPVPKDPPGRSKAYLAFVRAKPCCSCSAPGPSDPHHYAPKGQGGGMGMKCSDMRTVPLCRECHDAFHAHGAVSADAGGRWRSRPETHLLFTEAQVGLLVEWIERKEER